MANFSEQFTNISNVNGGKQFEPNMDFLTAVAINVALQNGQFLYNNLFGLGDYKDSLKTLFKTYDNRASGKIITISGSSGASITLERGTYLFVDSNYNRCYIMFVMHTTASSSTENTLGTFSNVNMYVDIPKGIGATTPRMTWLEYSPKENKIYFKYYNFSDNKSYDMNLSYGSTFTYFKL